MHGQSNQRARQLAELRRRRSESNLGSRLRDANRSQSTGIVPAGGRRGSVPLRPASAKRRATVSGQPQRSKTPISGIDYRQLDRDFDLGSTQKDKYMSPHIKAEREEMLRRAIEIFKQIDRAAGSPPMKRRTDSKKTPRPMPIPRTTPRFRSRDSSRMHPRGQ